MLSYGNLVIPINKVVIPSEARNMFLVFCTHQKRGSTSATSPIQSTASTPTHCSSPPLPRVTGNQTSSSRPPLDPQNAYSAKHTPPLPQFPSKPNHASSQSQSPASSATPESTLPLRFAGLSNLFLPVTHQTKIPLAPAHFPRQTLSGYAKSPYRN